jgi:putative nucleotidyltransferase with HDIG domain
VKDEGNQKRKPSGPSSFSRKLSFTSRVRNRIRQAADWVLAADVFWSVTLVVVVMLLLGTQRCGAPVEAFRAGEVAPYDIEARYEFEMAHERLTEERREEARQSVSDVYQYDADHGLRLLAGLREIFESTRRAMDEAGDGPVPGDRRIPEEIHGVLLQYRYSKKIENALEKALRSVMSGYVMGNKALIASESAVTILRVPEGRMERFTDFPSILDLDQARESFREETFEALDLPDEHLRILGGLASVFIDTNLSFDPEGTRRRQEEAARAVTPVLVRVPAGTVLVEQGRTITQEDVRKFNQARQGILGPLRIPELLGLLAVVCMLAFFLRRYTSYHQRRFRKIPHLHALLVMVMLFMLLLTRGLTWIVSLIVEGFRVPFSSVELYTFLVPIGAGAVLVTLLANGRIAIAYSAFTALLFGALNGYDLYLCAWAFLVQLGGVYAISHYRSRATLLRAGLIVGCTAAASCLALEVLRPAPENLYGTLYGIGLAFLGGALLAGIIISFSLPILEAIFKVLTEIRLLELSNVDTPLLSQLAVKAPGSYNHSLVVGTLAEEAAKAIGADSLFCRVAAFYHDVGKMMKPEYYVENQRGENPHDKLAPSMSSLIIASHVKDGIRLAREAGLPEQIVDIIPQHHGTRLMTYFYERARTQDEKVGKSIKKEDFRYPGPKPRTREAAIFMLADAVEAAARTVEEPTANRLREMIRKVSNAVVLDGQLEECDLTFVDLDRIQEAFLRTLVSIYHRRVDYPGFDFGKPRPEGKTPRSSGEQTVSSERNR